MGWWAPVAPWNVLDDITRKRNRKVYPWIAWGKIYLLVHPGPSAFE
jgi:hypothetical protein